MPGHNNGCCNQDDQRIPHTDNIFFNCNYCISARQQIMKHFLEIKNITTRNLVRGLSSKDKSSLQNQDLNRIRLSCPENEILGVTDLILNTPLIANKEFLSGFPKSTNDILFSRRFEPIGIRKEFLFQVALLNHDSKKLCKLICDIADLNESLFKSDYEASFTIIKRIIEILDTPILFSGSQLLFMY